MFGEAQLRRTLTTRPDAEALTSRVMAGNAWPSDLPAFEASCVHFENYSDGTTRTSKCMSENPSPLNCVEGPETSRPHGRKNPTDTNPATGPMRNIVARLRNSS